MTRTIIFACACAGLAVGAATAGLPQKADRADKPVRVADYRVAEPITYKNLTVFPIVLTGERAQKMLNGRYMTLDEGLKKGLIEIREMGDEVDEGTPIQRNRPGTRQTNEFGYQQQQVQSRQSGAQVNSLALVNKSSMRLVLLAGEMVVGGKQDRIVQKDAIIPPSPKPIPLAVFCVEQGRWVKETATFGNQIGGSGGFGGGLADPSVRGTAQSKADQGAVWGEVAKKQKSVGGGGRTGTYQTIVSSPKAMKDTSEYIKAIQSKLPRSTIGVVVAVNGRCVWVDLFSERTDLFGKYWPKLLRSYAMDAISTPPPGGYEREQWKEPTTAMAKKYLEDRSGNATFEGKEGAFKLRRTESKDHVIYDLIDIGLDPDLTLHTCKMERK